MTRDMQTANLELSWPNYHETPLRAIEQVAQMMADMLYERYGIWADDIAITEHAIIIELPVDVVLRLQRELGQDTIH